MTFPFLVAPLFFALGLLAGAAHFSLLAQQARALVRRNGRALIGSMRFAVTPATFLAAATAGALPLVAALAGFVAARALALCRVGKIDQ